MPFSPRRSLLGASTLLFAASSLALLTPGDASATKRGSGWARFRYYSDASLTTQVGQCDYNVQCFQGRHYCSGTQTAYYTGELINQCSF
jgi:hypothetical protein